MHEGRTSGLINTNRPNPKVWEFRAERMNGGGSLKIEVANGTLQSTRANSVVSSPYHIIRSNVMDRSTPKGYIYNTWQLLKINPSIQHIPTGPPKEAKQTRSRKTINTVQPHRGRTNQVTIPKTPQNTTQQYPAQ